MAGESSAVKRYATEGEFLTVFVVGSASDFLLNGQVIVSRPAPANDFITAPVEKKKVAEVNSSGAIYSTWGEELTPFIAAFCSMEYYSGFSASEADVAFFL